jgi:Asp-tRNA(Asn)/Glu-tRNA(Gln) amidotransferase A subunit family amidase
MGEPVPANPRFAFVRTPKWDQVEQATKDGLRELIDAVNEAAKETISVIDLPAQFAEIYQHHQNIMEADLARSFAKEYADGKSKLSAVLREMIERGQKISPKEYQSSVAKIEQYSDILSEIFEEYDAILTPSTSGPAPTGLTATGSPIFNTIWTFCGNPAINLPLLQSPEGLPVGIQIVADKSDDARLFRSTRWLLDLLND